MDEKSREECSERLIRAGSLGRGRGKKSGEKS